MTNILTDIEAQRRDRLAEELRAKRGLGAIAVLRGDVLRDFIELISTLGDGDVYQLSFAVDDGLKVKVNNQTWSVPLGTVER